MSRNYDNWEKLMAAVIKRQEIWELCHQHSTTPSTCSEASSSDLSSMSTAEIQIHEVECIEQCEPCVYITIVNLPDGTREIKRVRFRWSIFQEHQAEMWWSDNREKVCEKYNVQRSNKSSVSGEGARNPERALHSEASSRDFSSMTAEIQTHGAEWVEQCEPDVYITLVALRDGTRDLKRVCFSRRRFDETQILTWWSQGRFLL